MTDMYKPETALSVLTLFSTSKDGIERFSNQLIQDVKEGRADALKVRVLLDTMVSIAEIVDKATKPEQLSEASKYGERPFNFMGAELHATATKTEYDYETCGDVYLNDLEAEAAQLAKKIKARKELLKSLGEITPVGDPTTGDTYTVCPPIKKTTTGLKVTIK